MEFPLLISFYTKNTIYEKEIEDLVASCKALQLELYVEGRADLGSWEYNCCQKPLFILECLEKFKRPLLWVDADAMILKKPPFIFGDIDLAIYFNNFQNKLARTGTIYLRPTQETLRFVKLWHETCQGKIIRKEEFPYPDQTVFSELLYANRDLKIGQLPIQYTQVFDKDLLPFENSCIIHFQSSRTALMDPIFWKHLSGKELKLMRMEVSQNLR
ncbi:MAG: hypothetical protein A3E80_02235 [Chlamydiae bacterium RIFCSPHIGHO2_12_FULL_49_9]|nr:MAG: hypothetical protein A3E80_02235 [Chlamydiae bacterium RIFCSPHIGHO2_12_FULL_49_9]